MIVIDVPSVICVLAIILIIVLLVKFSKFLIWYIQSFVEFFVAVGAKIVEKISNKKSVKIKKDRKSISSYYSDYHM